MKIDREGEDERKKWKMEIWYKKEYRDKKGNRSDGRKECKEKEDEKLLIKNVKRNGRMVGVKI